MSEPAHPADVLACGGRYWVGEVIRRAVLAWPGEPLPVAAVLRDIQPVAAGPFKFAAAFRPCSIGHLAVHPISQP